MKKRLFLLLITIFLSKISYSQTFTYYPFNDIFSIASNVQKPVWVDFRMQTNSYFSALSTEISPMFNLNKNERAKFYMGVGSRFNFLNLLNDATKNRQPLEGYFICGGVRASPVAKIPRLQVVFELSPYVSKKFDLGQFRANLGLGYILGKKK